MRPDLSLVVEYFHNYINLVPEDDINEAFEKQTEVFGRFLETIPPEKYSYRYGPDKWTVQEVLQHIIDCERIFEYRALRFARKDSTPLSSFDENLFAANVNAHARPWEKLVEEFKAVRRSSQLLFASFNEEELQARGTCSDKPNYVLGWGYITIGHSLHHMKLLRERYLS